MLKITFVPWGSLLHWLSVDRRIFNKIFVLSCRRKNVIRDLLSMVGVGEGVVLWGVT